MRLELNGAEIAQGESTRTTQVSLIKIKIIKQQHSRIWKTIVIRLKWLPVTIHNQAHAYPSGFMSHTSHHKLHFISIKLLEDPQTHHDFSCPSFNSHRPLPIKQMLSPFFRWENWNSWILVDWLIWPRPHSGRSRIWSQFVWLQSLSSFPLCQAISPN